MLANKPTKLEQALDDIIKKRAFQFKEFWIDYNIKHTAPIPDDEAMWKLFQDYLEEQEKLHHA